MNCKPPIRITLLILPSVTCLVKLPQPPPNLSIATSRGRKSGLRVPQKDPTHPSSK